VKHATQHGGGLRGNVGFGARFDAFAEGINHLTTAGRVCAVQAIEIHGENVKTNPNRINTLINPPRT
jgi:hypothetical protein